MIDQKAREIAVKASGYETLAKATDGVDAYSFSDTTEAARLGIIEGLEMGEREIQKLIDAKYVEIAGLYDRPKEELRAQSASLCSARAAIRSLK